MQTLENKSYVSEATAFEELHRAFQAFRETNDDRLAQVESKLSADVLTDEKLARIDRALDETKNRLDRFTLEAGRPRLGAATKNDHVDREHKAAFGLYMRAGEAGGLKAIEQKAMTYGSGPDGGYLVPVPAEREILRRMSTVSPIRQIANVVEISGHSLRRAFSTTGPSAGWVAETDPRPQTTNQQISDMTFPAM